MEAASDEHVDSEAEADALHRVLCTAVGHLVHILEVPQKQDEPDPFLLEHLEERDLLAMLFIEVNVAHCKALSIVPPGDNVE